MIIGLWSWVIGWSIFFGIPCIVMFEGGLRLMPLFVAGIWVLFNIIPLLILIHIYTDKTKVTRSFKDNAYTEKVDFSQTPFSGRN